MIIENEPVEIRGFTQVDPCELRRLIAGYTSPAKYVASKEESTAYTVFRLELVPLAQPYVKKWEVTDEEVTIYQKMAQEGHSMGAYVGKEMLGIALAEPRSWNKTLWIWEFHIAPTCRGQGVGRRLMDAMVVKAREAGLRTLLVETQNTNAPAITFYYKVGFEIEGIDLSYYTNTDIVDGEIAIFMKRKVET